MLGSLRKLVQANLGSLRAKSMGTKRFVMLQRRYILSCVHGSTSFMGSEQGSIAKAGSSHRNETRLCKQLLTSGSASFRNRHLRKIRPAPAIPDVHLGPALLA